MRRRARRLRHRRRDRGRAAARADHPDDDGAGQSGARGRDAEAQLAPHARRRVGAAGPRPVPGGHPPGDAGEAHRPGALVVGEGRPGPHRHHRPQGRARLRAGRGGQHARVPDAPGRLQGADPGHRRPGPHVAARRRAVPPAADHPARAVRRVHRPAVAGVPPPGRHHHAGAAGGGGRAEGRGRDGRPAPRRRDHQPERHPGRAGPAPGRPRCARCPPRRPSRSSTSARARR